VIDEWKLRRFERETQEMTSAVKSYLATAGSSAAADLE
jgi:hypothetical protein